MKAAKEACADGKDLSWSSNFSSVASKQWNWAINSCLFEASQVTLGRQTAIKLGLGHPITFLHMSVKIEFAMEATKHIHIVLVAGPIHDGIFKLIPRQNCTDGLHWGYFCLFLCQNYKAKWEIWGKYFFQIFIFQAELQICTAQMNQSRWVFKPLNSHLKMGQYKIVLISCYFTWKKLIFIGTSGVSEASAKSFLLIVKSGCVNVTFQ